MTSSIEETTELREASDDIQTAIDAGINLAVPSKLTDDLFSVVVPAGAEQKTIDLRAINPHLNDRPARKTGTVHVHNAAAFVDYLTKHALPATEVWADEAKAQLVGVINAHESAGTFTTAPDADQVAGWGDHRCELELIHTPEWIAWLGMDKKNLTQQQFAEHLEDNAHDVIDPDAATMLEIAQHFTATVGADVKSAERLSNGEIKFNYTQTITAKAGQTGELEIPQRFAIQIVPFVGGQPVDLIARFRYRLRQGELTLSYHLLRPHEALQAAFEREVDAVRDGIDGPLYAGRPE